MRLRAPVQFASRALGWVPQILAPLARRRLRQPVAGVDAGGRTLRYVPGVIAAKRIRLDEAIRPDFSAPERAEGLGLRIGDDDRRHLARPL